MLVFWIVSLKNQDLNGVAPPLQLVVKPDVGTGLDEKEKLRKL